MRWGEGLVGEASADCTLAVVALDEELPTTNGQQDADDDAGDVPREYHAEPTEDGDG